MKKYVVIYSLDGGIAHINNVGIFAAETPQAAEKKAKTEWRTIASLDVVNLEEIKDRWSYFTH